MEHLKAASEVADRTISIEGYDVHERNPEGAHTIVLVGGLTEGIEIQSGLSEELANEGYRVVSFDPTTQPAEADPESTAYHARNHEAKSEQIRQIIAQVVGEVGEATLAARSHGAIFAIDFALEHPEKVDRVMLMNPAGLFEDSIPRLGGRFATENIGATMKPDKEIKKELKTLQKLGSAYISKNPKSFIGDAFDIARSDIREKISQLRAKGVKVDAFISANDKVFPWRLIEGGLNPDGHDVPDEIPVDSISSFYATREGDDGEVEQHEFASKSAGHGRPIHYPKQTASLIRSIVTPEKDASKYPGLKEIEPVLEWLEASDSPKPKRREAFFGYVREKVQKLRGHESRGASDDKPEGKEGKTPLRRKLAVLVSGALAVGAVGYGIGLIDDEGSTPAPDRTEQTTTTIREDVQTTSPNAPVVVGAPETTAAPAAKSSFDIQPGDHPWDVLEKAGIPAEQIMTRLHAAGARYQAETGKPVEWHNAADGKYWIKVDGTSDVQSVIEKLSLFL